MPSGGEIFVGTELVEIERDYIRRVPEARAGKFVCLQVRDTGEGMTEDALGKIFEPFFTTKETGKGTGMGLATVHGIVKQHDGWIEVTSTPGAGSAFRVYFPVAEPGTTEISATSDSVSGGPIEGYTVLLAEDDGDVRKLARHVLEEFGLQVFEAVDGPSALVAWQEHREEIDLLLTDMVMPGGISGADLAHRILTDCPDLPVIYSSGYSINLFGEDRQFRKDVNYLPKPYLARELISIVTNILAGRSKAARSPLEAA
jgi:CheY-like chemotaxis protein